MKKCFALFGIAAGLLSAYADAPFPSPADPFEVGLEETVTVPLPVSAGSSLRSFERLPLSFVRNNGQADPATKFEVRGRGYLLSLEQTEAVMALTGPAIGSARRPRPGGDLTAQVHLLRMKFVGAQAGATITGEDELPGKFNYFIGNDPALWRTNVPSFAKVRYREVYPGIDLVYYGKEGQLEYDFVVKPGANPGQIAMDIEGADSVEVDVQGDLRLELAGRELFWRKPVLFQEINGLRIPVPGEYVLHPAPGDDYEPGTHRVGFCVSSYNPRFALVIDPVLAYSTYLGGALAEWAYGVAVDAQGSAYVTGETWSQNNFPTTTNRIQRTFTVNGAVFVTKFNPTGDKLLYSTVLTGSDDPYGESWGKAIRVDSAGSAIVVGGTPHGDFPLQDPLQATYGGGSSDPFVTKLSPEGAALVFSTYLGGSDTDVAISVALGDQGEVHVAGVTKSPDFPTRNALQAEFGGGSRDLFIAKITASGDSLVYSTYLGDDRSDLAGTVTVDSAGRALAAWMAGEQVRFVRFNPSGTALDFQGERSLVGEVFVSCLAFDASGKLLLAGQTQSDLLPTTTDAFQRNFAGSIDAFVAKVDPITAGFEYLTYLGGTNLDFPEAIMVDATGNAYVVGQTSSVDFPTAAAIQAILKTGTDEPRDGFVTKFSPDGSRLVWSTFLGGGKAPSTGDGWDKVAGAALGPDGGVFLVGQTQSSDFPVLNAYQRVLKVQSPWMSQDAFVAKIIEAPPTLQITRAGSTVSISWPVSAEGFNLESSVSLGSAANWNLESTTPSIAGDRLVVMIEIGGGSKFFRLKRP